MSGLDFDGLSTVCATCDSDIEFPDGDEKGICRQCGEAFLLDIDAAVTVARIVNQAW